MPVWSVGPEGHSPKKAAAEIREQPIKRQESMFDAGGNGNLISQRDSKVFMRKLSGEFGFDSGLDRKASVGDAEAVEDVDVPKEGGYLQVNEEDED